MKVHVRMDDSIPQRDSELAELRGSGSPAKSYQAIVRSLEFLLFGVRGTLPFQDHTIRSWQVARRTEHSRKPFLFRGLIEQVSPGPYLELYGREEQPNTGWTVYGNQVERRLF